MVVSSAFDHVEAGRAETTALRANLIPSSKRLRSAPPAHRASSLVDMAKPLDPFTCPANDRNTSASDGYFGYPPKGCTSLAESFNGFSRCEVIQLIQQTLLDLGLESSRAALEKESGIHIQHDTVPTCRLSDLLWQAVRFQQHQSLFNDIDAARTEAPISLLTDCTCEPSPPPVHCVGRLALHSDEVWFAALSNDGQKLASSSKDGIVILCEFRPPSVFKLWKTLHCQTKPCACLAWSPDDEHLLGASLDGSLQLWAAEHCDGPGQTFKKHSESVTNICWLPKGSEFLSAGLDRCIFLWSTEGCVLHRWDFANPVQDIGIAWDGSSMVAVNSDHNIRVVNISTRKDVCSLPESDAVTSICTSRLRDEVLVNLAKQVTCSQQRPSIHLWDLTSRRIRQRYFGHSQSRFVLRSCFGGQYEEFVISGSEDALLYIWNKQYGSLLHTLAGHTSVVSCVCWSNVPGGGFLVSSSDDQSLRIWSAAESELCDVHRDSEAADSREAADQLLPDVAIHESAEDHRSEAASNEASLAEILPTVTGDSDRNVDSPVGSTGAADFQLAASHSEHEAESEPSEISFALD